MRPMTAAATKAFEGWIELSGDDGRYRHDVASRLPRPGERVLFVATGWVYIGHFHPADEPGSAAHFRPDVVDELDFPVVPGAWGEVVRWTGID